MANLSTAFKNTGFSNSEKDVFDEAIVKKNGWFFYGESKPDIPAYNLSSIYVYNEGTFSEEANNYTSRQLIELLSIRYNIHNELVSFIPETQEEWKSRLDYCTGKRVVEEPKEVMFVTTTSSNVYEQFE